MCSSACCNCCAGTSLIGVVFFLITATMVKRENAVFLSHKAGVNLHGADYDDVVAAKFLTMIYTACVSSFTLISHQMAAAQSTNSLASTIS